MPFPDQEFYAVRDECERFRAALEMISRLSGMVAPGVSTIGSAMSIAQTALASRNHEIDGNGEQLLYREPSKA